MRKYIALSIFLSTVGFGSTVNLTLATDPIEWSTLTTSMAMAPGFGQSDSINWSQQITTPGPVRSGYMQLHTDGVGSVVFGSGSLRTGIAGGLATEPQTEFACNFGESGYSCGPGNGYYGYHNLIPVMLGTPITLESVGSISTYPNYINLAYYDGGYANARIQFRFFDTDNATPVSAEMVSDAPEPSTWGVLLVAAGLGIMWVRKGNRVALTGGK